MTVPGRVPRREFVFLALAVPLGLGAATACRVSCATMQIIAGEPSHGTEPAPIQVYADALAKRHGEIRLEILSVDGVRDSAAMRRDVRADLAVVRPDADLPDTGRTLAIRRDRAPITVRVGTCGLPPFDEASEEPSPPRHVALVEMPEADPAGAFAKKRVDAVLSPTARTARPTGDEPGLADRMTSTGTAAADATG